MKKVTKAVIPAAGLGTRVLPATKALPKEMLTIVDKPSLQYIVEELVISGITDIVIVTGRNKNLIEDHFDFSYELENTLKNDNKLDLLEKVSHISNMANIYYVRQNMPLGLGHAGCQEVEKEDVSKYGIAKLGGKLDDFTFKMLDFLEKPSMESAPSRIACLGRYLLSGKVFKYLEETKPGKNSEIQLTDGILAMMKDSEEVLAYNFTGKRYDIGSKFGLLKANIEFGLRNEETKEALKKYLKNLDIEKI